MQDSGSDHPQIILFPPIILLTAAVVSIVLDFIPVWFLPPPGFSSWLTWLGIVVFVIGLATAVSGSREFSKQGTNIDPGKPALKLVTSGPYRFTRNPMYLGMSVMLLGLILAASLEWGVLVWPVFVLTMHFGVVLPEERYLTARFGQPYADLLARTRRWL